MTKPEIIDVEAEAERLGVSAVKLRRAIQHERDAIEKAIADDPLWAAQEIIDHGSRELINRLKGPRR